MLSTFFLLLSSFELLTQLICYWFNLYIEKKTFSKLQHEMKYLCLAYSNNKFYKTFNDKKRTQKMKIAIIYHISNDL